MTRTYDPSRLIAVVRSVTPESVRLGDEDAPRHFDVHLLHRDWPIRDCLLMVTVDPDRGPIAAGLSNSRRGKSAERTDVLTYQELGDLLSATVSFPDLLTRVTADAIGIWYHQQHAPEVLAGVDVEDWTTEDFMAATSALSYEAREVAERALESSAPRRRRAVNQHHLRDVAQVYREALKDGTPPTRHVADHFHVSHSTAARWVSKARAAGELGPATGPRPGEATD